MCTNAFPRWLQPMQGLLALALALLAGSAIAQSVLPLPAGVRNVAGTVRAILVQADGRVVLGGSFTAVDGIARSNLARLNADGSVDLGWNPGTDGSVMSLAATATTIYVGGWFDHAGGQPRASIAAVDSTSGAVLDWNPGMPSAMGNFVLALATDGATVYAGGAFQAMGGETRANLAAINGTTGTALPWNPSAGGLTSNVNALVVTGGKVIVGGLFEEVGGQSHRLLASIDASTGVVDAWTPMFSDLAFAVRALATDGQVLYVAGDFLALDGESRAGLAAIDLASHQPTAWNPDPIGSISSLAVAGTHVYVGGHFSDGGPYHAGVAELDAADGAVVDWHPSLQGDDVLAIAPDAGNVHLGGTFTRTSGQSTGGYARLDAATAALDASPQLETEASVDAMAVQPDGRIVIGGRFTEVAGIERSNIARLEADGAVDATWNPSADRRVAALALHAGTVYAGGSFWNIAGHARQGLAAIDGNTGEASAWNPSVAGVVYALLVAEGRLYVGGSFSQMQGAHRNFAAFDLASGNVLPWSVDADSFVNAIAATPSRVYIGGSFATFAGQSRSRLAAIDSANGSLTAWSPAPDRPVAALAVAGDTVYAGGHFAQVDALPRAGVAAIDAADGSVRAWNPFARGFVLALSTTDARLYAGGYFSTMADEPWRAVAAFDLGTSALTPWAVELDAHATSLAVSEDDVFVGGPFQHANGLSHAGIVALTLSDDPIFADGCDAAD
ncbi:hypothetical protein [Dokdonella sp.]|uniref:hypothetical protein n=1 Tax=Dokdonella sp. TaxID=2291710 RepID=UPI002F40B2FB